MIPVPAGWSGPHSLSDVCDVRSGFWGAALESPDASVPVNVIRNGDINSAGHVAGAAARWFTVSESERARVVPGDVLFTGSGDIGKSHLVSREDLWVSNFVKRLRPRRSVIEPRYLAHLVRHPGVSDVIDRHAGGSTIRNLRKSFFGDAWFSLPPLAEQVRLADLLDDHLSRLDVAERLVSKSTLSLSNLTQLVVEHAIAGSGPVCRLDDLTARSGYGTSEKCVQNGAGVAVVRIPNLVSGAVDLSDEKRVLDQNADMSRLMLETGDLLVIRTNGSRDLIGRTAVVQDGIEAAFASYLIRFQLDRSLVVPEWVQTVLSAPSSRRTLESLAASSAGQYNLSLSKLGGVQIPVPSLPDQARLLATLEETLGGLSRSREQTMRLGRRVGVLRRALLVAALTGRVAPTTPLPDHSQELAHV